jgi:hypothetical protein
MRAVGPAHGMRRSLSLKGPDSLIYCDGLFTILPCGESYAYETHAI